MVNLRNQSMSMMSQGHSESDFQKIWMSGGTFIWNKLSRS